MYKFLLQITCVAPAIYGSKSYFIKTAVKIFLNSLGYSPSHYCQSHIFVGQKLGLFPCIAFKSVYYLPAIPHIHIVCEHKTHRYRISYVYNSGLLNYVYLRYKIFFLSINSPQSFIWIHLPKPIYIYVSY